MGLINSKELNTYFGFAKPKMSQNDADPQSDEEVDSID